MGWIHGSDRTPADQSCEDCGARYAAPILREGLHGAPPVRGTWAPSCDCAEQSQDVRAARSAARAAAVQAAADAASTAARAASAASAAVEAARFAALTPVSADDARLVRGYEADNVANSYPGARYAASGNGIETATGQWWPWA